MHQRHFLIFLCVLAMSCESKTKVVDSCGDDFIDPAEDCDGLELGGATCAELGFYEGTLACDKNCRFDTSGCEQHCGDGIVQPGHEQCEDIDFQGATCESLGYSHGTLTCSETCQRDVAGCVSQCGDAILNPGESCDDGNIATQDGCSATCSQESGWTCSGSPSICTEDCGDGLIVGAEQCDDGVNDGAYGGCLPGCQARAAHCGDGVIDAGDGELCDSQELAGATCQDHGYLVGSLACSAECSFDESGCLGKALQNFNYGGTSLEEIQDLAVDSAGNVILAGYFSSSISLGGFTATGQGGFDAFIVKIDPAGQVLWGRAYVSAGEEIAYDVAVDAQDNIYVTGVFQNTVSFGEAGSRTVTAGLKGGFLLKLDPSGTAQWVRRFGGNFAANQGRGLAVASNGSIYLTGSVQGGNNLVEFEGLTTNKSGKGESDIFIAVYLADGTFERAVVLGSSVSEEGVGITLDGSDRPTIFGHFTGTLTFASTTLTNAGQKDVFVAKFDPTLGAPLWARQFSSASDMTFYRISGTADGRVALTGLFGGSLQYGTETVDSVGASDGLVAVLDGTGARLWWRALGGIGADSLVGVSLSTDGGAFVAGMFVGQASLGTVQVNSNGTMDGVLARLDPVGQPLWALGFGNTMIDSGLALGHTPDGRLVLGARFTNRVNFGLGELVGNANSPDIALAWFIP